MRQYSRILVVAFLVLVWGSPARAQLGQLLSPGPLSRPHAQLEGSANCSKCHEAGRQVSAGRCLQCHKPVAERIAQKKGVHRNVTTGCVSCHVEHAGRDAELRPFDAKTFDHRAETGFALDGRHAGLQCSQCHKTRSFLGLSTACASCHADPHKGQLGTDCAKCHTTAILFKTTSTLFDHARTAFPLEGAHRNVACAKCHANQRYSGLQFKSCADCHSNPHKSAVGHDCASCHNVASWHVANFDHARTGTPLAGKHQAVPCARCHVQPATQVRLSLKPCASCHKDPHRGAFKDDCASCHSEQGFKGAPFNHNARTRFALEGKHAAIACAQCHKQAGRATTADFRGLRMECASCHNDPHRGALGSGCEKCHNAAAFRVTTYQHPRFPEFFVGQHATAACDRCHRGAVQARVYKNLATDCVSCHKDPHGGQFAQKACTSCHAVDAAKFAAVRFQHETTSFPLTGKHRSVACRDCHRQDVATATVRFRGVATACASCHIDVHLGQMTFATCASCHTTDSFRVSTYKHRNPRTFFVGKHASASCGDCHKAVTARFPAKAGTAVRFVGLASNCANCHADPHRGQMGPACERCHDTVASWTMQSRAFHKAGLFPLEGRHLTVACADCHRNGIIKGTPTRCFDCHAMRREDDKFHQTLGNECESCHRPTAWSAVMWDHAARTGVPLNAAHRSLGCDQCHRNGAFGAALSDCVSCHLQNYDATTEPNHRAAGFPLACQVCHRVSDPSWDTVQFSHATFPLAGVHKTQSCGACHVKNVYKGTPRDCAGCHKAQYDATKSPSHAAAGFATTCDSCHRFTDSSWTDAKFAHASWPLVGRHAAADCASCHKTNVYRGLSTSCVGCHRADFDGSKEPNHSAAGFPTTCDTCHRLSDSSWHLAKFDHATFPLAGVHATQACSSCHRNGVYAGTARTCSGCHQADYSASKSPNHAAAAFPTTCDSCHKFSDARWADATYAHISWPLIGQHVKPECAVCHASNVYRGLPSDCLSCHRTDYSGAKSPNHVAAGFPTGCETCHKIADASWQQGIFQHTTFVLAGVHATTNCSSCHQNNIFKGTPRTCAVCHQTDYANTKSPNHAAAGFPTACDSCHKFSDASWQGAVFSHSTFPLAGQHATAQCGACHKNNVYAGTPRTCAGCHQTDYNNARNPNHVTAGFPTTCDVCHKFSDATWQQGIFTHSTFPLAGAHTTQPCSACHKNNVYKGTPRTCAGCHQTDYNNTNNPNHAAAGFPTTCDTCHRFSDVSWSQAVFNHTWFPITSGPHAGHPCNACHTVANVFSTFSCTVCHDRTETDSHHRGVSGYRYDSVACYACHPTGRN